MQIDISYPDFVDNKQCSSNLGDLLHACISRKLSLQMSLGPTDVTLSVVPLSPTGRILSLTGRWRSSLLAGEHRQAGALVLAPFVFAIEKMCLPHGSLFTLGRANRSVADFLMRNLFHAACRHEQMTFHSSATQGDPATAKGSRDLARTYLWIAKANLKEKIFERSNAAELILACAHLPLFKFTNPLLEAGATDCRRVAEHIEGPRLPREQKLAFKHIRERVLTFYRT